MSRRLAVALIASASLVASAPAASVASSQGPTAQSTVPTARAATAPLVIGPGRDPAVAVDSSGTAHVVYNDNAVADQLVHYCRLARGAGTCGSAQSLVLPGSATTRPYVFVDGTTVRILAYRYGLTTGGFAQDFLLTSTDGGQTFSPPVSAGTLEADDAVAGPGGSISIVSAARSTSPSYQQLPTDGSKVTTAARLSTTAPYETTVGLLDGKTPVAAFNDGAVTPEVSYSLYRNGDANADASWSGWVLGKGSAPHLAGGPVGLFLMMSMPDRSGAHRLTVFSLDDEQRFSDRRRAAVSDPQPGAIQNSALVQDDAGVLQALYASGAGNGHLFQSVSGDQLNFGTPKEIVADVSFAGLRAAAGRDHAGVAVWNTGVGADAQIHATPFATDVKAASAETYDLRAKGLEVTQAVQTQEPGFVGGELPSLYPAPRPGALPQRLFGNVRYQGVQLAAFSKTVVRFFADATAAAGGGKSGVAGVIGVLRGYRGGKELPGSPLLAENGLRTLTDGLCPCVTAKERANPAASYDFTLPLAWTISGNQRLSLRGELRQQAGILTAFRDQRPVRIAAVRPRECSGCAGNNQLTLTDIPFIPTPTVVIAPVRMLTAGQADLPDPASVFEQALNLHPGGERFVVQPYQADLDVTAEAGWTTASPECKAYVDKGKFGDCKTNAYFARVSRWDRAQGGLSDMAVGVNRQQRGSAAHSLFNLPFGNPDKTATPNEVSARPVAVVEADRPLSSVGHELGHLLGRGHASAACGGNGEDWAPDQVGYVDGIGLDRSQHTRDPGSPYRVVAGKPPVLGNCGKDSPPSCGGTDPQRYFDLMSYCGSERSSWISVRNWQAEMATLNRFGQRVGFSNRAFAGFSTRAFPSVAVPYAADGTVSGARAAAVPRRLHVEAITTDASTRITDVGPAVRAAPPATSSDYVLVVAGRAGAALSTTPMVTGSAHSEGGGPFVRLAADVPFAAQAASVAVLRGGVTVASRARSAHPPTVRVTSPARGSLVGRSGVVRWIARDADHDPLTATVAYSLDDGRHWRTIYSGLSTGHTTLPGSYFSASRRARVLVRVNDGFDETGARSQRFRARGVPPTVRLQSPAGHARVLNTSTLVLAGEAFDDSSQPIRGRHLTWFAGRRRLGTGGSLSAADLAPGRQQIRLVATDRTGRRGSASATVTVIATTPQLLELTGPKKLSRTARSVTLRIAVSARSTLTVGGRSYTVGRRASRVRLPIRAGSTTLKLRLALRAGAKRTALSISLPRS